jgi:hypothetical protein
MKPFLRFIIFLLLFCHTMAVNGQLHSKTPKWMCGKGFWVIVSNRNTPKNCTIYFYTNERELVYKEVITGRQINTEKIKTRKHLDRVLNQAVTAWQKEGIVKENQQMVVSK